MPAITAPAIAALSAADAAAIAAPIALGCRQHPLGYQLGWGSGRGARAGAGGRSVRVRPCRRRCSLAALVSFSFQRGVLDDRRIAAHLRGANPALALLDDVGQLVPDDASTGVRCGS